jgi:hypothetical protein
MPQLVNTECSQSAVSSSRALPNTSAVDSARDVPDFAFRPLELEGHGSTLSVSRKAVKSASVKNSCLRCSRQQPATRSLRRNSRSAILIGSRARHCFTVRSSSKGEPSVPANLDRSPAQLHVEHPDVALDPRDAELLGEPKISCADFAWDWRSGARHASTRPSLQSRRSRNTPATSRVVNALYATEHPTLRSPAKALAEHWQVPSSGWTIRQPAMTRHGQAARLSRS